jgi:haloalkane dehalogenase
MKILRTPEERFQNLADYPFKPNYIETDGIKIHYVDEGKNENETVLMMHGEPSWSFLYRKMIKKIINAGCRVVAPDLPGFGKSDKPSEMSFYTYQKFVDWMTLFLNELDLNNITLVCQDWGGLIGLRLAAENGIRFKRITASNTGLPIGGKINKAFLRWQKYAKESPKFEIGNIVNRGCLTQLSMEIIDAYNAPFPDDSYKAGARIFPSLVPTSPDDPSVPANLKAWESLYKWEKPFLTAFADSDPITKGGDKYMQEKIPGAKGQKHVTIEGAAHFVQEDKGEEWADIIIEFIKEN